MPLSTVTQNGHRGVQSGWQHWAGGPVGTACWDGGGVAWAGAGLCGPWEEGELVRSSGEAPRVCMATRPVALWPRGPRVPCKVPAASIKLLAS